MLGRPAKHSVIQNLTLLFNHSNRTDSGGYPYMHSGW
ncbi:protein of unknown function [Candidatus Promineifilum breve]|uniref:Uncharacterized protein n=1 Tax=Candidatus Promineifilum breve TaxID=1806508 RepID=A0A170PJW2_9CHLR|nr:protein of unknown function [Candidatus Promineifilum breve]